MKLIKILAIFFALTCLTSQANVFDAIDVDVSATEAGLTTRAGVDLFALAEPPQNEFDRLAEQVALTEARKATGSTATGTYIDPDTDTTPPQGIMGHLAAFAKNRPYVASGCGIAALAVTGYGAYEGGKALGWWGGSSGGSDSSTDDRPNDSSSASGSQTSEGDATTVSFGNGNIIQGDVTITVGRTTTTDNSTQADSENETVETAE